MIMDNTAKAALTRAGWPVNVGLSDCIINYYVLLTVLMLFLTLKFPRMKTTRKVINLKRRNLKRKVKSLHLILPWHKSPTRTQTV